VIESQFATLTMISRRTFIVAALALSNGRVLGQPADAFHTFLSGLWTEAAAKGVTRATFDTALAGVTPDMRVLMTMQRAPEYGQPFGVYVNAMASSSRLGGALQKAAQWGPTLRAVEKQFGVPGPILVSIWGIESSFGGASDHWDVFRSLATLAQAHVQHPFFHDELLSALEILQTRHIPRQQFLGSFAGAMGQTQFVPSSYLKYAVDFDGDGKADIWTSVPDVLGSIANYLQKFGWQPGVPWGFEVVVPHGFDYRQSRGTYAEWAKRGVSRADGTRLPETGDAILFFPSGAGGPAFLVTPNFVVLKSYNNSDAYALSVAHLADRMRGQPPFRSAWPNNDFQPSRAERVALQYKLADLGYKVGDFAGHLDFDLRDVIRTVQQGYGMVPDGYPSRALLDRLGIRAL
jgi:membrane-bound lytic murein transglycosylase B